MLCHCQDLPHVFIYVTGYWGCRNSSMCTSAHFFFFFSDCTTTVSHFIGLVFIKHFGDAEYGAYVVKIQVSVLVPRCFLRHQCVFHGKFSTGNLKHSITIAPLVLVFQRKQCIHPERNNTLEHLCVSYPGLHLHLMKCPLVPRSTHSLSLSYTLGASTLPYCYHCAIAIMNCILYS